MDSPVPDGVTVPQEPVVHYLDFDPVNKPKALPGFQFGDWVCYGGAVYKPKRQYLDDQETGWYYSGGMVLVTDDKGQALPWARVSPVSGGAVFLCSGQETKQ